MIWVLVGVLIGGAGLLLGLRNWRWSVYGLLLYLPVSGIPIVLSYPDTHVTLLFKDLAFVIPAYVGFALTARRQRWTFAAAPLAWLLVLAGLLLVQSFNSNVPNLLVAMIGLKVWLFYIPLLYLGYHLVSTRIELKRALALMSLVAVLPAVVGIAEQILLYGGQRALLFNLYRGDAASFQNFAHIDYIAGRSLYRVPSTFSFTAQYFAFALSMVAISYAWWRLQGSRLAMAIWVLMIIAVITAGLRSAFVIVPLLVLIMGLLDRVPRRLSIGLPALAGLVATLVLAGGSIVALATNIARTAAQEFTFEVVTGAQTTLVATLLGKGTGTATGASRYVVALPSTVSESWWLRVWYELGVPGLVLVVVIFGLIVSRAFRAHRELVDPRLRGVSASLLAFLIVTLFYLIKGPIIELDPVNVYFWLFAGILFRLPEIDTAERAAPDAVHGLHEREGKQVTRDYTVPSTG